MWKDAVTHASTVGQSARKRAYCDTATLSKSRMKSWSSCWTRVHCATVASPARTAGRRLPTREPDPEQCHKSSSQDKLCFAGAPAKSTCAARADLGARKPFQHSNEENS